MKGYICVIEENILNYFYIVVDTQNLIETQLPVVNRKFAVYTSPTEVTIKKIISFKDKSKRNFVVGRIEYFNDFTILRVGDIKHLSCRIYKSFKAVKYRYYANSYAFLHKNCRLKEFRNDGSIKNSSVYENDIHITTTLYFEDIILKISVKKNKTVVINRQTKEVRIHPSVLCFYQLANCQMRNSKCFSDLQKIYSQEFFHLGLLVVRKFFDVNGCLTGKQCFKNGKGLNVTKTCVYQRNKIQIY
jgi:hypothetical protein